MPVSSPMRRSGPCLSEKWQAALDSWQIPMFHMTDFENRQKAFKNWTEEDRRDRLNHLLGLIKEHTFSSIAFTMWKTAFDDIMSEAAKFICGDAYGLAAIGCFFQLGQRAADPKIDGYIDYFVESGTKGSGALSRIYEVGSEDPEWVNETRILSLSFQDKVVSLPFQAADILAYEIFKQSQRQFGEEKGPTRYPLPAKTDTPPWRPVALRRR